MASRELANRISHSELEIINERPYVWASFVWNMFDFGAAHRTEGDRLGINDKGLVTHDRKIKRMLIILSGQLESGTYDLYRGAS